MSTFDKYVNPLATRYSSPEMQGLFSEEKKISTWRKLWIGLAKAEKELGLPITEEQIKELEKNVTNLNLDRAKDLEKKLRHDVMAHIHAYSEQCPKAAPIIHLGATSCFVTDNGDTLIFQEAIRFVLGKLEKFIEALAAFCLQHKNLPCLGYTHFQPAQPTTVGKRASLWLFDFFNDLKELWERSQKLPFLGVKGTTGTQASFLNLFEGDLKKVIHLDEKVSQAFAFSPLPISGQTYSRKFDILLAQSLSGIAQSASKMASDIRLLSHLGEVEEPFEDSQVGSSAMAYKRNPMRSERICGIARFASSLVPNLVETASSQWMERTLDDSSNRRLVIPQLFLAIDALLNLATNVISGLKVFPKIIEKNLNKHLPFFATENILMHGVKKGGDRQLLHEKIRKFTLEAKEAERLHGEASNLEERLLNDPDFSLTKESLERILEGESFIGIAPYQVESWIDNEVFPFLETLKKEEFIKNVPNYQISV